MGFSSIQIPEFAGGYTEIPDFYTYAVHAAQSSMVLPPCAQAGPFEVYQDGSSLQLPCWFKFASKP